MKKKSLILLLIVCAVMFFVGRAAASVDGVTVYVDCGQVGEHTVVVPTESVGAFLESHPHAQVAPCTTPETPPVITPVIPVIDTTPGQTYFCWSNKFLSSAPFPVYVTDAWAAVAKGWTLPVAVTVAEAAKQGITIINTVGDRVLACDPDGLTATGTGYNGSGGSADLMSVSTWAAYQKEASTGDATPFNHYAVFGS